MRSLHVVIQELAGRTEKFAYRGFRIEQQHPLYLLVSTQFLVLCKIDKKYKVPCQSKYAIHTLFNIKLFYDLYYLSFAQNMFLQHHVSLRCDIVLFQYNRLPGIKSKTQPTNKKNREKMGLCWLVFMSIWWAKSHLEREKLTRENALIRLVYMQACQAFS